MELRTLSLSATRCFRGCGSCPACECSCRGRSDRWEEKPLTDADIREAAKRFWCSEQGSCREVSRAELAEILRKSDVQ